MSLGYECIVYSTLSFRVACFVSKFSLLSLDTFPGVAQHTQHTRTHWAKSHRTSHIITFTDHEQAPPSSSSPDMRPPLLTLRSFFFGDLPPSFARANSPPVNPFLIRSRKWRASRSESDFPSFFTASRSPRIFRVGGSGCRHPFSAKLSSPYIPPRLV